MLVFNLLFCDFSLTSFLDHLTRIETDIFDQWVHHCKEVESVILDLGKTGSDESIDTVDGAKNYMKAEEVGLILICKKEEPLILMSSYLAVISDFYEE